MSSLFTVALIWVTMAVGDDTPLISQYDIWPGYDNGKVYVPDSVERFRFVVVRQDAGSPGHDHSVFAFVEKCVWLHAGGPSDLRAAAAATGHPEIPNLPVMSDGSSNEIDAGWLNSNFPNQVLAHYSNFGFGDASAMYPRAAIIHQNQDDDAGHQYYGGSVNNPEIYVPNWGWPHGYYGAQVKTWPLYATLARLCTPAGWDFTQGKATLLHPVDAAAPTEWRGDPSTWHDVWPVIAPKARYSGSNGVWLPTEEYAWLWRSAVSRHPTQTMYEQGEANFGQTLSNSDGAGQANIMIATPTRPYQNRRAGGKNWPLYALNTRISVQVKNGFYTGVPPYDLTKIELYDGMHKTGEITPNPYNIYIFSNVRLERPGMRFFIAIAYLADGTKAVSRPAPFYVTDRFETTPTGVVYRGSRRTKASAGPAMSRRPRIALEGMVGNGPGRVRFDIRGRMVAGARLGAPERGVLLSF